MKPRIHGRLSALQMPGFLGSSFHCVAGFGEIDSKNMKKNTGITVTKTWGKGWGLEIKDQRQKTNAKLVVSLGWWFAILGVPLSNSPFHYKIQESKPQAQTTNLPLAVERQTRGKNKNQNTG